MKLTRSSRAVDLRHDRSEQRGARRHSRIDAHIIARAAEIEAGRRIPLDIVQALKSAGVFRIVVPRGHGGLELALPTGLESLTATGLRNGSCGWAAMICPGAAPFSPLPPTETHY